jgi:hypothetical protein
MMNSFPYLRKLPALVAASLILPALAYADRNDHGRGDNDNHQERGGGGRQGDPRVSSVPEPNTAWVLIPFMGAVLLFGSMNLWRQQKNAPI